MTYSRRAATAAVLLVLVGLLSAGRTLLDAVSDEPARAAVEPVVHQGPWRPLDNDCSAGRLLFTFDDGPDEHTRLTMRTLQALGLQAVFFVEGQKLRSAEGIATIRDLHRAGFAVENHLYDHPSITGATTGEEPLTAEELRRQLTETSRLIESAGLPRPTLYRPPFGDVDAEADAVARRLGYRVVLSWGEAGSGIVDSRDWSGASAEEMVRIVTEGRRAHGDVYPPARDGSIIALHDGQAETTLEMLTTLQPIVDWMNREHLCSTATVRRDATGGVVPRPAPPAPPASRNLVENASLEDAGGDRTVPRCFEQGGAESSSGGATWSTADEARSGAVAQQVSVAPGGRGDRKLVLSQRDADAGCLARVVPGSRYGLWVHYRGEWSADATAGLAAYYRDARGWHYWTSGPGVPASGEWTAAFLRTPAVPAGAEAISFGLALRGPGDLSVDDFAMAPR